MVEQGIDDIAKAHHLSSRTRNRYASNLNTFLAWMARRNLLPRNPLQGWEPAAEDAVEHRRPLEPEEVRRLLDATEAGVTKQGLTRRGRGLKQHGKSVRDDEVVWALTATDRALLWRFTIETGLRRGAIERLAVGDFDLEGDEPGVRIRGKPGTKNAEGMRLPLMATTAMLLRRRFLSKLPAAAAFTMPPEYATAQLVRDDLAAARVAWISEAKTPEERAKRAERDFLSAEDAQGRRVDFHALRTTTATLLDQAGGASSVAATITGHKSEATLRKHYHRSTDSQRRLAVEAMGRSLALVSDELVSVLATGTDNHAPENTGADRVVDCANSSQARLSRADSKDDSAFAACEAGSKEPPTGLEPATCGLQNRCSAD